MCLERTPYSDDDIELKLHLYEVHSAKVHLKELVEMCTEAEEREEREGWNIDDILYEERERREIKTRKKAESGGCNKIFKRKKGSYDCLENEHNDFNEVCCFLCQEKLIFKSLEEFNNHIENQHRVSFGVKEIKKSGEKYFHHPNKKHLTENTEIIGIDEDSMEELD